MSDTKELQELISSGQLKEVPREELWDKFIEGVTLTAANALNRNVGNTITKDLATGMHGVIQHEINQLAAKAKAVFTEEQDND